jgi:hypothetical protein
MSRTLATIAPLTGLGVLAYVPSPTEIDLILKLALTIISAIPTIIHIKQKIKGKDNEK